MNPGWLAFAGLALMVAAAVFLAATRGSARVDRRDTRRAQNAALYAERLAELERRRAQGMADDEYAANRNALDRQFLADLDDAGMDESAPATPPASIRLPMLVALLVPLLAAGMYGALGAYDQIRLDSLLRSMEGDSGLSEEQRAQHTEAILPLLEKLSGSHDADGEYRYLLASSYFRLGRYPEAAVRYLELAEMYPQDAMILAQAARSSYLAAGSSITEPVQRLIDRVLALDPNQPTLLGMMGMHRFQQGQYREAIDFWQRLLRQLPADAPDAAIISQGVAMARSRLGAEAEAPEVAQHQPTADGERSLHVRVSVASGLQPRPDDTVFVFAKAAEGPPMPLAVARFRAAELPRDVELDDSMAMAPGLSLSSFDRVVVVARISRSGSVSAQAGDLEGGGLLVEQTGAAQSLEIVIDREVREQSAPSS